MRRPDPPRPHADLQDPRLRDYARLECSAFLADVFAALRCPIVPGPSGVVQRAQLKGAHLRLAASLGFAIPDTLVTSDRDAALAFWQRHEGRVSAAHHRALGEEFARYAEKVTHRDLMHLDALRFAPATFQSYVDKKVELRATVIGDQVWTVEIDSQASNQACEDWRRYDLAQTPHRPHALPDLVQRRCVELLQRFGLRYGAIDLVLTPDDRYVFLELNPSGQYLWLEELGGLPLSRAIADLLVNLSKDAS
jgi:glutathione synthase/RimK-type ligase-like ATP-grasp enzyme